MSAKFCRQCGVPLLDLGDDGLCDSCRKLQQNPDGLSKMTKLGGVPFKDMKHLDEDDRVKELVRMLNESPTRAIGFMVDNGPERQGKGDRIIEKVKSLLPTVKILRRCNGPVANVETISFRQT
jgi:hypothetical protein